MGRLARAFRGAGEGGTSASVDQACKVHESHGTRDSQRLFQRFGLRLNVWITYLKVEGSAERLPFLRPSRFLTHLLKRYSPLLFGGHRLGVESEELCERFWTHYQTAHPDHAVYQVYPHKRQWRHIVPIAVHGDKGRGYKKSPVFVFSFEVPFGLPESVRARGSKMDANRRKQQMNRQEHGNLTSSCGKRAREQIFPEVVDEESCPKYRKVEDGIPHNSRGSTFMSRFLITAIPNKLLKEQPQVVDCLLKELRRDLTDLFQNGMLSDEGQLFKVGLIGIKGDFEFHLEMARYNRSYSNIGTRNSLPYCPECLAGSPGVAGMDFRDAADWLGTLYATPPWDTEPVLNGIPFDSVNPAKLYRKDVFHMLKFGVLKDLGASTVMYLGQLGYWDTPGESRAIDARLARAYAYFKLWCDASGKCTTLKKFSSANFHRKRAWSFPYLGGKGSDAVLLCSFLDFYLHLKSAQLLHPSHGPLLQAMRETVQGALSFVGIMHSHDCFLSPPCAAFLAKSGMRLIKGYAYLASRCIDERRCFYALRPKLHFFQHTVLELQTQVSQGDTHILSPAVWNCEANEDYIGRICRIGRRVSPRLTTLRTLEYYLVACKLLFRRAGL